MAAPTRRQVHLTAALGNISIAYKNDSFIASEIFPVVPVQKQSDKYFIYEKTDWFRNEAAMRAPGTRGPLVEYSLTSDTYSCQPIAAGTLVPDEIVDNADNPLQPMRDAVEYATQKVMLKAEVDVAADVFGNSVWSGSATPSTTWDDDASDPLTDVEIGREYVVGLIGREPNVIVMGRNVWTDLRHHPDLLDRIKYTSTGVMTPQLLGQLFGVQKLLIGNAIYDSAAEGATSSYSYVWGKHLWIGFVPPNPGLMVPAAGYLFTWKNRQVETYRLGPEKTEFVRVEWHYDSKVTAADAGYLCKSCVA